MFVARADQQISWLASDVPLADIVATPGPASSNSLTNTRFGNIVRNIQYTIDKTKPFGGIMYPITRHFCNI